MARRVPEIPEAIRKANNIPDDVRPATEVAREIGVSEAILRNAIIGGDVRGWQWLSYYYVRAEEAAAWLARTEVREYPGKGEE